MNTSTEININARATGVRCSNERLYVHLMDNREISVPLQWFPRLAQATPEQRENWRLIGRGVGLRWPDIDEDISVTGLLDATDDVTVTEIPETGAGPASVVGNARAPVSIVVSGPEEIAQSINHLKHNALAVAGWMEWNVQERVIPSVWVEPNGRNDIRRIVSARDASPRELIPVRTRWWSAIPQYSLNAQGIARLDITFMLDGGHQEECAIWFPLPEYLDALKRMHDTGAVLVFAEQPTSTIDPPDHFGIQLTSDQIGLEKLLRHCQSPSSYSPVT